MRCPFSWWMTVLLGRRCQRRNFFFGYTLRLSVLSMDTGFRDDSSTGRRRNSSGSCSRLRWRAGRQKCGRGDPELWGALEGRGRGSPVVRYPAQGFQAGGRLSTMEGGRGGLALGAGGGHEGNRPEPERRTGEGILRSAGECVGHFLALRTLDRDADLLGVAARSATSGSRKPTTPLPKSSASKRRAFSALRP